MFLDLLFLFLDHALHLVDKDLDGLIQFMVRFAYDLLAPLKMDFALYFNPSGSLMMSTDRSTM
jgi:hypothetical protein